MFFSETHNNYELIFMLRHKIHDECWPKLAHSLYQLGIYNKTNLKNTIEGIIYHRLTGISWRYLPSEFGKWFSVYKQFLRWSKSKIFMKIFKNFSSDSDNEWCCCDSTYIKVHQDGTGGCVFRDAAIGMSRGGRTTKIHLATNAYGLPIEFEVTSGQVSDVKIGEILVDRIRSATYIIADKGYDSEKLRQKIRNKNVIPVIPRKENSRIGNDDLDKEIYKYRHQVENAFQKLKRYKGIAMRSDKLKVTYESAVALICILLWLAM
jgi:transposase